MALIEDEKEWTERFSDELTELRVHLYSRAISLTKDRPGADDLVQETLVRALHARPRFHHGTNLAAWTNSIMRNLFIDGRRRSAVRRRWEKAEELPEEKPALGPLDVLSEEDVTAALAHLPARYREIFQLAYLENLSYREIADRLCLPMNTTGTRLLRAKLRVRKVLGEVVERRFAGSRQAQAALR